MFIGRILELQNIQSGLCYHKHIEFRKEFNKIMQLKKVVTALQSLATHEAVGIRTLQHNR